MQASDGNFYGSTSLGGNRADGTLSNDGTLYRITPAGMFTLLYAFSGPDGLSPSVALTQGSGGAIYGTTTGGGPNNGDGTIFRLNLPVATATVTLGVTATKFSEDGGSAKAIVTRTGDTSAPLTVSYSVKGSAVNGTNYKKLTGSVVIPAGSTTAAIKIKGKDDHQADGTHVLKLVLIAGDGYTVGTPALAKIKITDAD